jgi:hypothetical protein
MQHDLFGSGFEHRFVRRDGPGKLRVGVSELADDS